MADGEKVVHVCDGSISYATSCERDRYSERGTNMILGEAISLVGLLCGFAGSAQMSQSFPRKKKQTKRWIEIELGNESPFSHFKHGFVWLYVGFMLQAMGLIIIAFEKWAIGQAAKRIAMHMM